MEIIVKGKLRFLFQHRVTIKNALNFCNFPFSLRVLGKEEGELEDAASSKMLPHQTQTSSQDST